MHSPAMSLRNKPKFSHKSACVCSTLSTITVLITSCLLILPTASGQFTPINPSRSRALQELNRLPLFKLHGGAVDITTQREILRDFDAVEVQDDKEVSKQDDLVYAPIGTLSFQRSHQHSRCDHRTEISISYRNRDSVSKICNERWELNVETDHDGVYLAAAETVGCLCTGIILNLPIGQLNENDMKRLDDFLYCIFEGMIRRINSIQCTKQEVNVPLIVVLRNEALRSYTEKFMNTAIAQMLNQNRLSITKSYSSLKIEVSLSQSDLPEAAVELRNKMLCQTHENNTMPNLAPRSMLGVLMNSMYKSICERLSQIQVHNAVKHGAWLERTQLRPPNPPSMMTNRELEQEENQQSTQRLSTGFRERVESLLAILFVDAEDSLREIGIRIDESFFEWNIEESLDTSIPDFGGDFDSIMTEINSSFSDLIESDATLTEFDLNWANDQRLGALEQIAGSSMHRLYESHLQNLRDRFGRLYQHALDEFSSSDSGIKGLEQHRRNAAQRAEEGFTKFAFDSIPQICRHPDGELCGKMAPLYSCVDMLRGLLEDMYEITAVRMINEDEWEDIMDTNLDEEVPSENSRAGLFPERIGLRQLIKKIRDQRKKCGRAKWYERWVGKILIVGLNYVQGWIVLQTLRQEARKRDQDMPKFPLF